MTASGDDCFDRDAPKKPREGSALDELYRRADLMTSAHSKEHDRLIARARLLQILFVVASLVLCSLTFADTSELFGSEDLDTFLKLTSVILLALSLLNVVSDMKQRAVDHQRAAAIWADIKVRTRAYSQNGGSDDIEGFIKEMDGLVHDASSISAIDEKRFPRLKHYHYRKKRAKCLLVRYANYPYPVAHLLVFIELWKKGRDEDRTDQEDASPSARGETADDGTLNHRSKRFRGRYPLDIKPQGV